MKSREDDDLEFMDLDDEEYDLPAAEDQDDEEELFDKEIDERTLRFVHRVLFPSVIGLVAVIVVVAAVFLFQGNKGAGEEAAPAMEEITAERETEQDSQLEEPGDDARGTQEDSLQNVEQSASAGGAAADGEDEAVAREDNDPETETMSIE